MKPNVGNTDMIVRVVAGILILALFFVLEGNARWWAVIGFVPLVTGIARTCPLYSLFGLSSCPLKGKGA